MTSWRPPLPVSTPAENATWQSLAEWMRVPWVKTWQMAYSGSTSSGSAADIPSASQTMSFRKLRDDTRLSVIVHGSFYCTTPNAVLYLYAVVDGVTFGLGSQFVNVGSAHIPVLGAVDMDGVRKGVHTITLQWARGFNTITVNSDDNWQVRLTETSADPDL